jgi:hypothetical protein
VAVSHGGADFVLGVANDGNGECPVSESTNSGALPGARGGTKNR